MTDMPGGSGNGPHAENNNWRCLIMSRLKKLLSDQRSLFLIIGAANTILATVIFAGLVHFFGPEVPSVVSLIISWFVSLLTGFFAHRVFVFRVSGRIFPDLMRYASVTYVTLVFNISALALLSDVLGLPPVPVQIGVILVAIVFSYVGHKFFSFRRKP